MSLPTLPALLALCLLASSCSTDAADPAVVTVAAAADLRFAMDELIAAYAEEAPEASVRVTYGSSGSFFGQISNGAPFDVFFSADIGYPRRLEEAGLIEPGSTRTYAVGQIAVWVPTDSPIDVEALGIRAVLDPTVQRIAIANPEHAPYGRAAEATLRTAGILDLVQDRLVLGENIAQAAQFVESGAAEIGIIALSLAVAPELAARGRYALVPIDTYPPLEQGAAVLNGAADPAAARAFLDFVLAPAGREVLDRYGFLLPER